MRGAWTVITVLLALAGFIFPPAWVGAAVTAVLAIASAPAGVRADGKRRSGGLLGGVWDSAVVSAKMRKCPYCKADIPRDARKCRYCSEWVTIEEPAHEQEASRAEPVDPEPFPVSVRIALNALLTLIGVLTIIGHLPGLHPGIGAALILVCGIWLLSDLYRLFANHGPKE